VGRKDEEREVMDVEKLAVEVGEIGSIEDGIFGEEDERGEVEGEMG